MKLDRRGIAFLFALTTETGPTSLFHAASLAIWGVHDRTRVLEGAVVQSLNDPQVVFYPWAVLFVGGTTPMFTRVRSLAGGPRGDPAGDGCVDARRDSHHIRGQHGGLVREPTTVF